MTAVFFLLFSWFMVTAKNRRQVLAVTLVGTVAAATVVSPTPVMAQSSLTSAIQAVLNVINGLIKTALNSINTVRNGISSLYQSVIWPVNLIDQAKAQVTQMITQYRTLMQNIFHIDLASATLPVVQQLEAVMRNPTVSDFNSLSIFYGSTYGPIPTATAASLEDRVLTDMDDALALDNLKTLKATDSAVNLTLQAADQLENASSQAAPGSAPFLTASAAVAGIQSQAVTQRMLAAELRQEAARLAHKNVQRKRLSTYSTKLGTQIMHLLKRN